MALRKSSSFSPLGKLVPSVNPEETLLLFAGNQQFFSNWNLRDIVIDGFKYNCGEQRMMHAKALLFGDLDTACKIMATKDPKLQKALGREVKNFDKNVWDMHLMNIVTEITYTKLHTYPEIENRFKELLKYKNIVFVEAAPWDKIWGVGLAENDSRILDSSKWLGTNFLGKCWNSAYDHWRNGTQPTPWKNLTDSNSFGMGV